MSHNKFLLQGNTLAFAALAVLSVGVLVATFSSPAEQNMSQFTGNAIITSANLHTAWDPNTGNPHRVNIKDTLLLQKIDGIIRDQILKVGQTKPLTDAQMKKFLTAVGNGLGKLVDSFNTNTDPQAKDIVVILRYIIHETTDATEMIGKTPNVARSGNAVVIGISKAEASKLVELVQEGKNSNGNYKKASAYILKTGIPPYIVSEIAKSNFGADLTELEVVEYLNATYQNILNDATLAADIKPTQVNVSNYRAFYGDANSLVRIIQGARITATDANRTQYIQSIPTPPSLSEQDVINSVLGIQFSDTP